MGIIALVPTLRKLHEPSKDRKYLLKFTCAEIDLRVLCLDHLQRPVIAVRHQIIRYIQPDQQEIIAGLMHREGTQDGVREEALFNEPSGACFTPQGDLLVADTENHVIRKISPCGQVTTIAGSGKTYDIFGPNGNTANGHGLLARFDYPTGIVCSKGEVFVADRSCLRKIDASGYVSMISDSIGGTALCMDHQGNFLVASELSFRREYKIRKLNRDGKLLANTIYYSKNKMCGLCIDIHGNVYFTEAEGDGLLRKITIG